MELLQLKYFQAVAKYENISKAAKELHISQPSLSVTIKRLEDELLVPLFNRKGKKIELSTFGEHFLKHTNSILNELENARVELLEVYGKRNKELSLAATVSFFLSGLLRDFLILNSEIKITQSILGEEEIIEKLNDRSLDFGITCSPIEHQDIETIELIEEEIVVIIHKKHPLANKKFIYLKELKDENFIELTENNALKSLTNKIFEGAGFKPKVIFEGDQYIISELIQVKQAIALAPISICIKSENDSYRILRLKDKLKTRKVGISYKKGRYLSELYKSFLEFAIEYYKKNWYIVSNSKSNYIKELFDIK
ncbi:MAG: LysR family transcriptional regulator [Sarcina sp.]